MKIYKVLVIEDDPASLELMRELLVSMGADAYPVANSEDAKTIIAGQRFDGIFLDLRMPKIDGYQLASYIRKSAWNRQCPIVVVTGEDHSEVMGKAFTSGATFFLHKPVDRRKLSSLYKIVSSSMLENQKKFIRVPFHTEVVYRLGESSHRCQSVNLSLEGVLLNAGRFVEPGTKVVLSFRLGGQPASLNLNGVVARVDEKRRLGVRFVGISNTSQQSLRAFVQGYMADTSNGG